MLFQLDKHSFFVFGFAKKDQANIPPEEERAYKELAKKLLFLTEGQIKTSLEEGELFEVKCNEENLQE